MKLDRKRISGISLAAMLAISGVGAGVASAEEPNESGVEAAAAESESTGIEAEGLGGHEDPDGVDVDHQNEGEE